MILTEPRSDLMDAYDPQSALECELVERLAGILWRLRRVPFFEAAILDARHSQASTHLNYVSRTPLSGIFSTRKFSRATLRSVPSRGRRMNRQGKMNRHPSR